MTKVDFYVLEEADANARWRFACRLTEKIWQQGHRVYLHLGSAQEAERMDELLWTFRGGSFIPHTCGTTADDPEARVHIGYGEDPAGHDDVLVNLAAEVPPFFSRFQRVTELVDGDEAQRQQGRARYRFYRDRGYPLDSHTIKAESHARE